MTGLGEDQVKVKSMYRQGLVKSRSGQAQNKVKVKGTLSSCQGQVKVK